MRDRRRRICGDTVPRRRLRTSSGDGCDRISSLPDELLGAILAFLPVRDAARTAVLSSRWRYLWSQTPLTLDVTDLLGPRRRRRRPRDRPPVTVARRFASALSGLLACHSARARFVRIDEDALSVLERPGLESLCDSLERKGIEELCFTAYSKSLSSYDSLLLTLAMETRSKFPLHAFAAAALRRLVHLKELKLIGIEEMGEDVVAAISGLPMLVSLEMKVLPFTFWDLNLHSTSLEMLKLCCLGCGKVRSIDAPNLRKLDMDFYGISGKYLDAVVSNLPKLHSLVLRSLWGFSSLSIHSQSLQEVLMYNLPPLKFYNIDAPNLGVLHLSKMHIPENDFCTMLSGLPKLHTLKFRYMHNFAKFHLTSASLRDLEICSEELFEEMSIIEAPCLENIELNGCGLFKEFSIIDAPTLKRVFISRYTSDITDVKIINAPRMKFLLMN